MAAHIKMSEKCISQLAWNLSEASTIQMETRNQKLSSVGEKKRKKKRTCELQVKILFDTIFAFILQRGKKVL